MDREPGIVAGDPLYPERIVPDVAERQEKRIRLSHNHLFEVEEAVGHGQRRRNPLSEEDALDLPDIALRRIMDRIIGRI